MVRVVGLYIMGAMLRVNLQPVTHLAAEPEAVRVVGDNVCRLGGDVAVEQGRNGGGEHGAGYPFDWLRCFDQLKA